MADIITRLKLESGEYDSKIKRAAQELLQYESHCRKLGIAMGWANRDAKEFAKALGGMETVSTSVRGKVGELTAAYTDLRSQYNRLTEEEKNSEFGKALNASLEQLKTRINDAKTELNSINRELGNTSGAGSNAGSILDHLADKFTINFDAVSLFEKGLSVAGSALNVAKDAFFASESNVDDWGRTVRAAESVYTSFLTALNTGDISGFLSRIGQIVSAAKEAYNELDRLGTLKTIQSPAVSRQRAENQRLQTMIRTGRQVNTIEKPYEPPKWDIRRQSFGDYMKQAWQAYRQQQQQDIPNGQKLTKAQIKEYERQLEQGNATLVELATNEIKQTTKAIEAVYTQQASEIGISLEEFKKGTSSIEELEYRVRQAKNYEEWKIVHLNNGQENPYYEYRNWADFRVDGDNFNKLVQLIQQRDQQTAAVYQMQEQAYRTINRAEGTTVRQIMSEGGGIGGIIKKYVKQAQQHTTTPTTKTQVVKDDKTATELTEVEKEAAQHYKEVAAKTKKLADAQEELRDAISSNDLKAYYAANKKAVAAGGQADTTTAFTYTEGNAAAFISSLKEQIAKADIGSDLYNSLTSQLKDANALASVMQRIVKADIQDLSFDPQQLWKQVFTENGNIPNETWRTLLESINEKLKEGGFEPIKLTATLDYTEDEDEDTNTGKGKDKKKGKSKRQQDQDTDDKNGSKVENQSLQELQKLTGGMGSLVSGLQQMGVKIPEGIQNVIGFLQGITTILSAIQTISAVSAIPFLHNGGVIHAATGTIVPGTRFSGDQIPAMLDAGEVVLNRAQAGVIASELQGGGARNIHISGELSGENLYLAINNHLKRTGHGELVTSH